jgi:hypothetical protein
MSYGNFKRLQTDLDRLSANTRTIDRKSLLGPIKEVLTSILQIHNEWKVGEPDWENWTNENLFRVLFRIFPQDASHGDGSTSLADLVHNSVKRLRFKNLEKFNTEDLCTYIEQWQHSTTKLGDVSTFTPELIKRIIRDAIDNITKDQHTHVAKHTATYIRAQVLQADPKTFSEYPLQFGAAFNKAKKAIEISLLCGLVASTNTHHTIIIKKMTNVIA